MKRVLMPTMFLAFTFAMAGVGNAQVNCAISASGGALGAIPALPGVTNNASDIGNTEVGASGPNGIADVPGGGRVRITCTNPGAAVNPGVVALTVSFGTPITNNQTHPSTAAGIRLINGSGDFSTPNASGPTTPNPGNVGIASIDNANGQIVIGLGTPGSTVGSTVTPAVVPTSGIAFTAGSTSSFELAGWLLSTSGKKGSINATLTSSGGIGVVTGTGTCTIGAGACTQVITNVQPSLQDPTVPTGSLPSLVTSLPNLGTTPIAAGPAVINSAGVALKSNFTVRVRENYADLFKSAAQYNTGGVFPTSPSSSVQVNVSFKDIPAGFEIAGCSAVLTDLNGAAPALPGNPEVSTSVVSPTSQVLTIRFTSPVDQANVDVLWITCTKVDLGSATLPLPSTPVTAQLTLGPLGDALSATRGVLTSLTTGMIPRYAASRTTSASSLISFGSNITASPSTPPAAVSAEAGIGQVAEVGGTFSPLRVTVRDRFGNVVSNATVTFASDAASNAGATFPRGNTVVTDASGVAVVEARANFSTGSYNVLATTGVATPAVFNLTNTQRLTVAVPALQSGTANQLGIAWTNTSNRAITLHATARGYDGQLINGSGVQNPVDVTVGAGAQLAKMGTEIFGAGIAGRAGWVELTASDAGLSGLFELFDNALTTSDGAAFPTAPSARLVFPHVDKDTVLYVVNTGDQSAPNAAVVVYDNSGAILGSTTLSIAGKGGWSGRITDLLPSLQSPDGYVVVDTQGTMYTASSATLVGMQSYQHGDAAVVIGQSDFELVHTGYAVHAAIGGGYATRVTLVNPASVSQQVQLTFNGATVDRTIAAYGRLDESLAQMFNVSGSGLTTGYLKVQTPSATGVSGYVEITAFDGRVRTTTPIAREAETRLLFSHVAQGSGYFTGLALLNAQTASATVTIEVDSPNGTTLASKVVTLQAGERLVGLIRELFPNIQNQLGGFVRVTSSSPIYGLEIFGSVDQQAGGFLTNVPAGTF